MGVEGVEEMTDCPSNLKNKGPGCGVGKEWEEQRLTIKTEKQVEGVMEGKGC